MKRINIFNKLFTGNMSEKPIDKDKYKVGKLIGRGSYGAVYEIEGDKNMVLKIYDRRRKDNKEEVKNIHFPFDAIREISIYKTLLATEHVIHDVKVLTDEIDGISGTDNLIIKMSKLDMNLHDYLRYIDNTPSLDTIKTILFGVIDAMYCADSKFILHRDVKPQNIMLKLADDGKTIIKSYLIDWGMSQYFYSTALRETINFPIQTIWYRSPEAFYGSKKKFYDNSVYTNHLNIDIWSIGIIALELATGKRYMEEVDTPKQMYKMTDFIGLYDDEIMSEYTIHYTKDWQFSKEFKSRERFEKFVKLVVGPKKDVLIDFIFKCLVFTPSKREPIYKLYHHKLFETFSKRVYPEMIIDKIESIKKLNYSFDDILLKNPSYFEYLNNALIAISESLKTSKGDFITQDYYIIVELLNLYVSKNKINMITQFPWLVLATISIVLWMKNISIDDVVNFNVIKEETNINAYGDFYFEITGSSLNDELIVSAYDSTVMFVNEIFGLIDYNIIFRTVAMYSMCLPSHLKEIYKRICVEMLSDHNFFMIPQEELFNGILMFIKLKYHHFDSYIDTLLLDIIVDPKILEMLNSVHKCK